MRIPKQVTQLSALNKAYAILEAKLAKGEFKYATWLSLADEYEAIGVPSKARELNKKAARIAKEGQHG